MDFSLWRLTKSQTEVYATIAANKLKFVGHWSHSLSSALTAS